MIKEQQAWANKEHINSLGKYTAGTFEVVSYPVRFTQKKEQTRWSHPTELLEFENKRVLFRDDTGEGLSVVGRNYKVVQYVDAWKAAENALINSGLNLEGITRKMGESHNGARAYAIYTLPTYMIETAKGDFTALQLSTYTSVDGSWSFMMQLGYVRLLCANMQISIDAFCLYKSKHTPSLSLELGAHKIQALLDAYQKDGERWKNWSQKETTDRNAFDTFAVAAKCKFPKSRPDDSVETLLSEPEVYKNRSLMFMWNQFRVERESLGQTEWAAFNAMTHWATHASASKKSAQPNIASIRLRRSDSVRAAAKICLAA